MKKFEVIRAVGKLRARFPKAKEFSEENAAAYCTELVDLDYEQLILVVSHLARTVEWFPSISEVRQTYAELAVQFPDPDELWIETLHWASKTGYGRNPIVMRTPPHIQDVIGFLGGWSVLGKSTNLAIERAHVMKAHPFMKARAIHAVRVALPSAPQLKELTSGEEAEAKEEPTDPRRPSTW